MPSSTIVVLCPGTPSSSKLSEPRLPRMVASSTILIPSGQTLLPILSENIDWPFLLKSASNACPMASCSRMPDAPAPMTTCIWPPLGRTASKALSSPSVIFPASSVINAPVSISAPFRRLRDTFFWTLRLPLSATSMACTVVIGRVSYFISPKELYMR